MSVGDSNSSPIPDRMETKSKWFDVESRVRDRGTAVALLVLLLAFVYLAGPVGLVAGLGIAGVWYAFGVPYAIAVGHVGLVGLFPDGIGAFDFVLIELAFVTVLLASVRHALSPRRVGAVALASGLLLGGVAWLVFVTLSLWIAAVVFVGLFTLFGYSVHRYELVRLGLVSEQGRDSRDRTEVTDE